MNWPQAQLIETPNLELEPLTQDHAAEMVGVLSSPNLYTFTGGEPPSLEELTSRYARQSRGHSADETQGWLNWIIREKSSGQAIGYVQATLEGNEGEFIADVAWVIGEPFQGHGWAAEAALGMVGWLLKQQIRTVRANINPENVASIRIAKRLEMHRTGERVDGEEQWAI